MGTDAPAFRRAVERLLREGQFRALVELANDQGKPLAAWPSIPAARSFAVECAISRLVSGLARDGVTSATEQARRIARQVPGLSASAVRSRIERTSPDPGPTCPDCGEPTTDGGLCAHCADPDVRRFREERDRRAA